jgi:2-iminobutanoate/2-iminopropanoate deaminase
MRCIVRILFSPFAARTVFIITSVSTVLLSYLTMLHHCSAQEASSARQPAGQTQIGKRAIVTEKAPKPIQGVYSQAVQSNGVLFLAGQIALTPDGKLIEGDTVAQLKQIFANIEAVLNAAGCTLDDIVKTTVFLKDMNDFAAMNEAYAAIFKPLKSGIAPARTTVEVARLPRDARIEIEVIAVQPHR